MSNWNDIETRLQQQPSPTSDRTSDDFWSEFRARAELMGQDSSPAPVLTAPRVWGAAMASAATFAVMIGIAWYFMGGANTGGPNVLAANEIKTIQVVDPSVGVMVYAADQEGTIIWITDAPQPEPVPAPESQPISPSSEAPTVTTPVITH